MAAKDPSLFEEMHQDEKRWSFLESEEFGDFVGSHVVKDHDDATTTALFHHIKSFSGQLADAERKRKRDAMKNLERELGFLPDGLKRCIRSRNI
jgi:hypothetical protein